MECNCISCGQRVRMLAFAVICNIHETTPGGFQPPNRYRFATAAAWIASAFFLTCILAKVSP